MARGAGTAPLERLRAICLALPDAIEKETWEIPTFRVRDKIFAMAHDPGTVWCKAPRGTQEILVGAAPERPCCTEVTEVDSPQYHLNCLYDPDVVRASKQQHSVQGRGGDGNLGRLRLVSPRSQRIPNHPFVSADRRLDFRANIIIAGYLPGHPAMPGDLEDVLVPPRRSGPG